MRSYASLEPMPSAARRARLRDLGHARTTENAPPNGPKAPTKVVATFEPR
jgi:hypothetical protein